MANEEMTRKENSANEDMEHLRKLASKEKTAGIIWLVIGILQVTSFIFSIVGIMNIVTSVKRIKYSKSILTDNYNFVPIYQKWITSIVISLVYNLIIGGIIGVIGCIYDLCTRNYVISNKDVFTRLSNR